MYTEVRVIFLLRFCGVSSTFCAEKVIPFSCQFLQKSTNRNIIYSYFSCLVFGSLYQLLIHQRQLALRLSELQFFLIVTIYEGISDTNRI